MGKPKITDKRWSIDLEKRIQEEHYGESYSSRYSFNPNSEKEIHSFIYKLKHTTNLNPLQLKKIENYFKG